MKMKDLDNLHIVVVCIKNDTLPDVGYMVLENIKRK
ncbi:hypothetical protein RP15_gp070 [Staphylococcus phage vB_Sau-RP15]|nr:hypothetical protein RP15_gp070 [Staphylococcus phage vB_Sau-RP15]BBI90258.1 hypothetical protein MRS_141 [Staphylococcus phage MR003]